MTYSIKNAEFGLSKGEENKGGFSILNNGNIFGDIILNYPFYLQGQKL
jgi:hypothetical protein